MQCAHKLAEPFYSKVFSKVYKKTRKNHEILQKIYKICYGLLPEELVKCSFPFLNMFEASHARANLRS